jgi:hypothetical protein
MPTVVNLMSSWNLNSGWLASIILGGSQVVTKGVSPDASHVLRERMLEITNVFRIHAIEVGVSALL